jgi:hypothetical protein
VDPQPLANRTTPNRARRNIALLAGVAVPGLMVALALLAMWLVSAVGLLTGLVYLGYLGLFILAPGCLLDRVLRPGPRAALDRLAVGWALGYAVELAVFALTAALQVRTLLPWLILGFAVASGLLALRTGGSPDAHRAGAAPHAQRSARTFGWGVAGLAVLGAGYLALAYFPSSPLPGSVASVTYYADFPFHLGVAAEALHHWPITDPKVSGTPLPYQIFVYMHLASAAQITGLGLPLILLRLDIPTMVVAFTVGLAAAGRALTGRAAVGLIAVVLVLFVGELHPNPNDHFTFLNSFFYSEYTSPTFLYGLVLFMPALQTLVEVSTADCGARPPAGLWVLLVILLTACAGAKATILPVLLGGSMLALAVRAVIDRRLPVAALTATGLVAAVFAVFQLTLYAGFTGGLQFNPPGSVRATDVMALIRAQLHNRLLAAIFWVAAAPAALIGFCVAPMIGLMGVLLRPIRSWPQRQVLLLCLLLAGLAPFLAFSQFGSSQNFFTYYGYVAGGILSAEGLMTLWGRWVGRSPVRLGRAIAIAAIGVVTTVGVIYAVQAVVSAPLARYGAWFGVLALVALVATWLVWRRPRGSRGRAAMAVVLGLLAFGALEAPLEIVPGLASALLAGRPLYDARSHLLTRGLYRGLLWVRRHTSPNAVLAVNNQYDDPGHRVPGYMYYSAFAERRIFLEGWAYTARANELGAEAVTYGGLVAFPDRLALNRAVFTRADPRALATMVRDYGVRYLLVDRIHGTASPALARLAQRVYQSPSLIVYRVG